MRVGYNNPPEDHRLASRGLLSDDKRWSRGTDFFYPTLTRIIVLLTTVFLK